MIRVVVNGARGRMGTVVCAAIATAEGFELVGRCNRGDDFAASLRSMRPDVVVDFTLPDVVLGHALAIVDAGARPVIGTSGLDARGREELARRCKEAKLGGIVAPNFAIGAVLMMRFAELAAPHLAAVEIVEAHHTAKKDAPSGTAIATADRIAAARRPSQPAAPSNAPARGELHASVPIHSLRVPGVIAEQSVVFGELGQKLVLQHVTYGREAYVPGVLLACRKVMQLDHLVVGLDALLVADPG